MEPEISRRCRVCGASVRSRAGFCPQCGAPVNPEEANQAPAEELSETMASQGEEALAAIAPDMALTASDTAQPMAQTEAVALPVVTDEHVATDENMATTEHVAMAETDAQVDAVTGDAESVASAGSAEAGSAGASADAQPTRRHRVKVAARDAMEGKIAPRVEKLRQASTVVLDEAADDPGLRFVLVAAVLILLSLGLLLLSQILT
jgi:hypothetical protein